MATTVSDVTERHGQSATVEAGLCQSLRTQIEFSWVSTSSDPEVVLREILADAALPDTGDSKSMGAYGTVRLESIAVQLDPQHKGHGRADLTWQRWETTPTTLRGGSGLVEVPTQKDKDGNDLTVSHQGQTQVGTVNKRIHTKQLIFEVVIQEADPAAYADDFHGRLNDDTWRGGAARTWLCTVEDYEPLDLVSSPPYWRVRFRFDYRADGWDEQVIFRDPETGRPPAGLVDGTGYIVAEQEEEADFTDVLSAS
jgi:hypothetical protein